MNMLQKHFFHYNPNYHYGLFLHGLQSPSGTGSSPLTTFFKNFMYAKILGLDTTLQWLISPSLGATSKPTGFYHQQLTIYTKNTILIWHYNSNLKAMEPASLLCQSPIRRPNSAAGCFLPNYPGCLPRPHTS